jgi:hypothetical protein
MASTGFRTWLRIVYFTFRFILCVVTVPKVIALATNGFPRVLGSRAFKTSPQFDGVAPREGLGKHFEPPLNHLIANALSVDGSIGLSPLYPNSTIDLHVRTASSLHQSFLWLHPIQA